MRKNSRKYKQGVTGTLLAWKYKHSVSGALLTWKYGHSVTDIRSAWKYAAAAIFVLALGLVCSIPAMAEPTGHLDWASSYTIAGWAWDAEKPDDTMEVTIDIVPKNAKAAASTLTVPAISYRGDLVSGSNDGNHGFFCPINWSDLSGDSFTITAYVRSGDKKVPLTGTISYDTSAQAPVLADDLAEQGVTLGPLGPVAISSAETDSSSKDKTDTSASQTKETTETTVSSKPAKETSSVSSEGESSPLGPLGPISDSAKDASAEASTESGWKKGVSLGIYKITGYCNCSICSSGWGLTYSGAVPKANHTISADINVLPIGTKVMINDIVYTVEDKGSSVSGNHIDIYCATHEEAVAYGTQTAEVFAVIAE